MKPALLRDQVAGRIAAEAHTSIGQGLVRFRKDRLYGLMDTTGQVLVPATYQMIASVGRPDRFLGFGPAYANIYNLKERRVLPKETVYAKVLGGKYYLSQSVTGYGLYDIDGKEIFPPVNQKLRLAGTDSIPILSVQQDSLVSYVYLPGLDLRVNGPFGANELPKIVHDRYLVLPSNSSFDHWVDLRTKKRMNCDSKFGLEHIYGIPDALIAISYGRKESYLIRADGQLIIDEHVESVRKLRGQPAKRIVTVKRKVQDDRYRGRVELTGIMDENFNWTVPPIYTELQERNWPYAKIRAMSGKFGLLDLRDGSEIIPPTYERHSIDNRSGIATFANNRTKDGRTVSVFETGTSVPLFTTRTKAHSFSKIKFCGKTMLFAAGERTNHLYTMDGKEMLDQEYRQIKFTQDSTVLALKDAEGNVTRLDCDLQPLPVTDLEVNKAGKAITKWGKVHEDLKMTYVSDEKATYLKYKDEAPTSFTGYFLEGGALGFGDLYFLIEYSYNGRIGVLSEKGDLVVPRGEGWIDPLSKKAGGVPFRLYPHTGDYLLPNGRLLFNGQFEAIRTLPNSLSFSEKEDLGLFKLEKEGRYGWGTESGQVVMQPQFSKVRMDGGIVTTSKGRFLRDGTALK